MISFFTISFYNKQGLETVKPMAEKQIILQSYKLGAVFLKWIIGKELEIWIKTSNPILKVQTHITFRDYNGASIYQNMYMRLFPVA